MPCGKKERKPMMPIKTIDILTRRRYVPNTQFYFTNRKNAVTETPSFTNTMDIKKPIRVLKMLRPENVLSYSRYSEYKKKADTRYRQTLPLLLKDNEKMAIMKDVSRRLYIEEPPNDIKTVCSIHPEFYGAIEGRPIRRQDDIKVYINNIRLYLMYRQQTGFRRDIVLGIDTNIREESLEYEKISEKLTQHIHSFQTFLTEDYKTACKMTSKAEKVKAKLNATNEEFMKYAIKLVILNNLFFKIDAIRSMLKNYRKFLLFVAPLSWRQKYDEALQTIQSLQDRKSQIFKTESDLSLDIDKAVECAKLELKNPLPACLFFNEPEQMMYVFRNMELQSREYLCQHGKVVAQYRIIKERINKLKVETKRFYDCCQNYVDGISNEVELKTLNELTLQKTFYTILNGTFYNMVASPSTLKLKICIEFVFEEIFGKYEEGHDSLEYPMKMLEEMYGNYNLLLDSLDIKIVTQAKKDMFAEDLKMMQNAFKAKRELREFRIMSDALKRAFLPPKKYTPPIYRFVKTND